MKKIISIVMICAFSAMAFAQDSKMQNFGDYKVDPTIAKEAAVVIDLLNAQIEVQDVTIIGKVNSVCQAKGCWMTIDLPNGEQMTIKFKDYGFFMPKDCSGKSVIAHGKTFKKTTSVAELKHLAEDAGKTKKEIKKIKAPKEEIRFEADGVILNA